MKEVEKNYTVLVVDDTTENVDVLKGILGDRYKVSVATNGELALRVVKKIKPDIILLDVMMPGMSGYEVCEILKSDEDLAPIPIIFVTALGGTEDEEKGFSLGAVDYITKPIRPAVVLARVATQLALADQHNVCRKTVKSRTWELEQSQRAAINMLGEAGHYNDTDTGLHIWRMSAYGAALAKAIHWPVEKIELIKLSAPMHDTGKIGISDDILKAPRKLTRDEWDIMKTHSAIGHRILSMSDTPLFKMAAEIALHHHEKWDGSGYPYGLVGEEIPESARIVAIADVFDALTMKRPYKEPWSVDDAMALIKKDAGSHFDPRLAQCFLDIESEIRDIKSDWDDKESSKLDMKEV